MKKSAIALLTFVSATTAFATSTVTSFTSGTPISSSAVNANFNSLKSALDAVEASNIQNYSLPPSVGAVGEYLMLSNPGGTLVWSNPPAGGLTSLNGITSSVQTFAVGNSGLGPQWQSMGSTHSFHIPMASASGVSAGLISKADYDSFNNKMTAPNGSVGQFMVSNGGTNWVAQSVNINNMVEIGGNMPAAPMVIGSSNGFPLILKSNNNQMLTISTDSKVGIGTVAPMNRFHVEDDDMTATNEAVILASGNLSAPSGEQYGLKIAPQIYYGGFNTKYTALKISVTETNPGTGAHKLIDAQVDGVTKFGVNSKGYLDNGGGFMGSLNPTSVGGSDNITCVQTTIVSGDYVTINNLNMDFGAFGGTFNSTGGVYEILLDLPFTGGSPNGDLYFSYILTNGTTTYPLVEGRNIKRIPAGSGYVLKAACGGMSAYNIIYTTSSAVFGIRKLN